MLLFLGTDYQHKHRSARTIDRSIYIQHRKRMFFPNDQLAVANLGTQRWRLSMGWHQHTHQCQHILHCSFHIPQYIHILYQLVRRHRDMQEQGSCKCVQQWLTDLLERRYTPRSGRKELRGMHQVRHNDFHLTSIQQGKSMFHRHQ